MNEVYTMLAVPVMTGLFLIWAVVSIALHTRKVH